jgi:Mrp family chromosome partitioning ATPase
MLTEALARSLTASGRLTIIVDADLAGREFTRMRGLGGYAGLTDALNHNEQLVLPVTTLPPDEQDASDVPTGKGSVPYPVPEGAGESAIAVLPAGAAPDDPAAMLRRRRLFGIIGSLRDSYEYVLVIGPRPDSAGESISLFGAVDHSVVVVTRGMRLARLRQPLNKKLLGSFLVR